MLNRKLGPFALAIALMSLPSLTLQASAKVTVNLWCQFGDVYREGVVKVAEAFNKSQKNIEVKVIKVDESNIGQGRLAIAMAAGAPPDCALFADLLVAEYAQKKLLLPLDSYVKASGIKAKDFWKPAWNVTFYDNKQWALPFTEDDRAFYYNKKVFRESGINPDRPPKTLSELDALTPKLFKGTGTRYTQVAYVPWGGNWWFYGWGWLFGGEFWNAKTKQTTINDPKNVEALTWLAKFAERYDVQRIQRSPQDFTKGTLVMYNDGNWPLSVYKRTAPKGFEFGVAPVPPPAGREISTWSGVWTMIIPRGAKHAKEAWEWMKFACGPQGQAIYAKITSQTPANINATHATLSTLIDTFGPQVSTFIDLMEYSHHRPTMPVGSFMWDTIDAAQWFALNGKKTPQKALDDANTLVMKELSKVMNRTKDRK